jgi:hypothetical protein
MLIANSPRDFGRRCELYSGMLVGGRQVELRTTANSGAPA